MKKFTGPEEPANNQQTNSTEAQRKRLLGHLEFMGADGVTTIQARELLDVMAPAPRIFELRHKLSLNIQTVWTWGINAQGMKHRTARYVLLPGSYKGMV